MEHIYLENFSLANFRNYLREEVAFPEGISLLVGDNAQGKTNLLEAIYYLATTRSPRTGSDGELVNWAIQQSELPFARLEGQFRRGGEAHRVEMTLAREVSGGSFRKRIELDGRTVRALEYLGRFPVVVFLPEDLALVGGAPSLRRRYLDATLCQLDASYARALQRYNRVLAHRNHLLKRLRARLGEPQELDFWDEKLAAEGAIVTAGRDNLIRELNVLLERLHPQLAGPEVILELAYEGGFKTEVAQTTAGLRGLFLERLKEERRHELEAGATSVGPHRDEMRFRERGVDLGTYGSRAQRRRAVVSLKLAEVELIRSRSGYQPILLLDDVMSELDPAQRALLARVLQAPGQAVVTATDTAAFPEALRQRAALYRVENGRIRRT